MKTGLVTNDTTRTWVLCRMLKLSGFYYIFINEGNDFLNHKNVVKPPKPKVIIG